MSIKKQFPSLHNKNIVYLDSAATSQTPQCVIDAISKFYEEGRGNVGKSSHILATTTQNKIVDAKESVLELLHAVKTESKHDPEPWIGNLLFTKGTTEAHNILAQCYPLNKDDIVILTELEHHAVVVPWQIRAKQVGATIKFIPVKNGELDMHAAEKIIDKGCTVLCVSHLSNVTGSVQDISTLKQLVKRANPKGVVFVDGAQAIAHLDIRISELGADAYIFGAHKMYGPTGIGALWMDNDVIEKLSPYQYGGDMIKQVGKEETTIQSGIQKLITGTQPFAQIIGFGEAARFLLANSHHREQERKLMCYAVEQLTNISQVKLLTCKEPIGCVSFTVDGCHPGDIGTYLNADTICVRVGHHCAQPLHNQLIIDRSVRASIGIYTEKKDIDTFIVKLKDIIKELTSTPEEKQ